jgi:hypothetical protein
MIYGANTGDACPDCKQTITAGWERAAAKLRAKAERQSGRSRGLKVLGSGAMLTLLGAAIMAFSSTVTFGRDMAIPLEFLRYWPSCSAW